MQTYSFSDDTGNVNAVNMTNVNLLEETFRRSLCLQSDEDDKDYIQLLGIVICPACSKETGYFLVNILNTAYCILCNIYPTSYRIWETLWCMKGYTLSYKSLELVRFFKCL